MTRHLPRPLAAAAALVAALLPLSAAAAAQPSARVFPSVMGAGTTSPQRASVAPADALTDDTVPLQVTLSRIRPVAPQPGDTLTITGTVRNDTASALSSLTVGLRISGALGTRGEFDLYAADPQGPLSESLFAVTATSSVSSDHLAAGQTAHYSISLPVDGLGLDPNAWQVHELGIVASGLGIDGTTTGQLRTFLPWAPRTALGTGDPADVAWIWPLVDRPHRGAATAWRDDDLAGELGTNGRLGALLAAGAAAQLQPRRVSHQLHTVLQRPVTVTWALDPMLVEDAADMTAGYTVGSPDGKITRGTGTPAAKSWLAQLRSAVAGHHVLPLPYADPDVTAVSRTALAAEIGDASTSGRAILTRDLPGSQLLSIGWPPGGYADERTVNALFAAQITTLVLSDQALPAISAPSETPSARTVLGTQDADQDALLVDSGLTDAVDSGASPGSDPELSLQQFLAETLMIQEEAPADQRDLVVAPDRRWDPPPSYAASLLADSGRVPWIHPVSLAAVAHSPESTSVDRKSLIYPGSQRRQELPSSYLHRVQALSSNVQDFGAVLPTGTTATRSYDAAVERDLSSALRTDPERDVELSDDLATVDAAMNQVHIASADGSFVTLTSHRGSVPVSITNNLDTNVTVVLQVERNQRLQLSRGGQVTEQIPAHQQVSVNVQAAAKTSGVFPLRVRLLTPGGAPYGRSVRLNVRSTVYGTITLVITGAAMAALLIAVAVRLVRRAVASRRPASGAT